MLMKVSIGLSLEMWMQCGPSHVKCGCNVDPPHLHILNVDVMWSNVTADNLSDAKPAVQQKHPGD